MNRQQFTQMAKRILQKQNGLQSPQIMHPAREWGVGLFVGGLLFIVSAGWSAQMYLQYRAVSVDESGSPDDRAVVYRASLVDEALTRLQKRDTVHESLIPTATTTAAKETVSPEEEQTASSTVFVTENEKDSSSFDSEAATVIEPVPEESVSAEN